MAGELPSNAQVNKFVARKNNVAVLEHCLDRTREELDTLKRAKRGLSFGPYLTTSQATALLPGIKSEVEAQIGQKTDTNVDISTYHPMQEVRKLLVVGTGIVAAEAAAVMAYGIPVNEATATVGAVLAVVAAGVVEVPNILNHGAISYYNPSKRRLEIGLRRTKHAYNEIAHEYTHHFHATKLSHVTYKDGAAVFEGHAVAVARSVCATIAEREDDPAYNYAAVEQAKGSLELAYIQACKANKVVPKKSLISRVNLVPTTVMDSGYAAFCIAEELAGRDLKKDVFDPKRQRRLFR